MECTPGLRGVLRECTPPRGGVNGESTGSPQESIGPQKESMQMIVGLVQVHDNYERLLDEFSRRQVGA